LISTSMQRTVALRQKGTPWGWTCDADGIAGSHVSHGTLAGDVACADPAAHSASSAATTATRLPTDEPFPSASPCKRCPFTRCMRRSAVAVLALSLAAPVGAAALPINAVHPPVLTAEVPAGGGKAVQLPNAPAPERTVDGRFGDWTGSLPGFGGAMIRSRGELVYQDHIFDAYGADNGQDAQRLAVQDPLAQAVPETYRVDPTLQYVPEELGIPTGPFTWNVHYGDLAHQDQADLTQVRLGTDSRRNLWLLARTTTMDEAKPVTALLVLLDTRPGDAQVGVGFGSGAADSGGALQTRQADTAVFLAGDHGYVQQLATGTVSPLPAASVATNGAGYDNALEARIPASLLGGRDDFGVAVAAGIANDAGDGFKTLGDGANLANVAFRTREPSRDWWEKQQALALEQDTIDPFFVRVRLRALAAGVNERYQPGPGYHDRIFESTPAISNESGGNGVLQHYGLYIPTSYASARRTPVQWWFHFRGGNAHIAAAVAPGIIKEMGEDENSIVVTPDGRGTSKWYVGVGHVDFLEVWDDVHQLLRVDRNREYVAGHSMGGWASWLLPILYPDRFAGAFPASGPVTQGAWFGCEWDQCYAGANGGRPRDQFTMPLLENLRWVPYANYQGAADELVPTTGVTLQMKRMQELGFRYRYYLFPHEEHYGPPVADQWAEGAHYLHRFARNPNPPQVTYIRSMPFERAVEEVNSERVPLSFDFDSAYWMSGLQPVDEARGVARFDGRSLAIPERPRRLVPEAGGPATPDQPDPYVMAGQAWEDAPGAAPPVSNGFVATLKGAKAVRLDLRRMRIRTRASVSGEVTTEAPLRLELRGRWPGAVAARIDGAAAPAELVAPGVIALDVPAGHHTVELG
jgi:pimeloyl-ACP methyl ester carboxylesterase